MILFANPAGTKAPPNLIPTEPTRLWTRDFVLNLLVAYCIFASYTAMFTLIPPYVVERGGADWQLGIIVGLAVRPFAGQRVYSIGEMSVGSYWPPNGLITRSPP